MEMKDAVDVVIEAVYGIGSILTAIIKSIASIFPFNS